MKKLFLYIFLGLLVCNVGVTESLDLSGTTWKFKESDGDIKLVKFHKNKKCSYVNIKMWSGNDGEIYSKDESNCTWNQNDNLITFEMNNFFIVRTGIINGNTIEGNFVSTYNGGIQGTFVGKLTSSN